MWTIHVVAIVLLALLVAGSILLLCSPWVFPASLSDRLPAPLSSAVARLAPPSDAHDAPVESKLPLRRRREILSSSATTGPRILSLVHELSLERVVVWGHPLGSHTHSYIHEAFVVAAESLGLEVHWVPVPFQAENTAPVSVPSYQGPTSHALYITEGQVVAGLPQDPSSWYLFHNVTTSFSNIPRERILEFQYWVYECCESSHPVFDSFHRISPALDVAYMPWATNLLPEQFLPLLPLETRHRNIVVIGQEGRPYEIKIERFAQALPRFQLERVGNACPQDRMEHMIQTAWCAPALMRQWQKDHGYIPCRIMKNISYGAVPVTTSIEADYMLHYNTLCHPDEVELARMYQARMVADGGVPLAHKAAQLVQTRHTYLNRIEFLLTCLKLRRDVLQPTDDAHSPPTPPSVLHLTCHRGCVNYLQHVGQQLGWHLDTLFMHDLAVNGSIYNMTAEKANQLWQQLSARILSFDHVVISDTASISRIVLQHMNEYRGRVTVWVCNRFDYHHGNDEVFPDPEWYACAHHYHDRVRFLSYTKVERMYALDQGVVWDNPFADAVIRPVMTILPEPPCSSAIPSEVQGAKSEYLFIPPYENDQRLINFPFLQKHNIRYYHGRYNGPTDLMGFKAILHIPYTPSNLALFENLSLGLVYYLPSFSFLRQLLTGNIDQNIQAAEWYDPRMQHLFVYFDSWDDLAHKLSHDQHVPKSSLVRAWAQREEQNGMFQWKLLIQ